MVGINSQQYQSVLEAWMVVGLYPGINDYDLSVEQVDDEYFGCPDSEIYPNIVVRNSGMLSFDSGTTLNLSYSFDGMNQQIDETVVLQQDLLPGDSIFYTFSVPVTFDPDMEDDILISLLNYDNIFSNNYIDVDLEFSDTPGSDLELTEFEFRLDDVCNPTGIERFRIAYRTEGCLPVVEGDSLKLTITTDIKELNSRKCHDFL